MPQTAFTELVGLGNNAKAYLRNHLVDFLEEQHSQKVAKKLNHKAADERLKPVEAFELEVKEKLSVAAHEVSHAVDRVEEARDAGSHGDVKSFLRYARLNLEEADKELTAAEHAYKSMTIYEKRLENNSVVISHEIRPLMEELFAKLEQLRAFQRSISSKVTTLLGVEEEE